MIGWSGFVILPNRPDRVASRFVTVARRWVQGQAWHVRGPVPGCMGSPRLSFCAVWSEAAKGNGKRWMRGQPVWELVRGSGDLVKRVLDP